MSRRTTVFLACVGLSIGPPRVAQSSEPPLHERIDRLVDAANPGTVAPPADDASFLRRIYLDLVGRIPSVEEARRFLDATGDDSRTAPGSAPGADSRRQGVLREEGFLRRARLIDQLLASPEHARRLSTWLDIILMERRGDKNVKTAEWRRFLRESVRRNQPYDRLVGEILSADGTGDSRPAARFVLDRDVEPHRLTRDVGRLFFGMDLQCAQCHDHPLIDGYLQKDYYGIYAFLHRSQLFTAKDKKTYVGEKAIGEVTFKSVFVPKRTRQARPRLPGDEPLGEPTFEKGKEYTVAPAKDVRPVPRFSRRRLLAKAATAGANEAFRRNVANRLWALMMGRGVVEPVDLHHEDNPPVDPLLLDLLADDIASRKFDMRSFLRQLALTRTYRRSSVLAPSGLPADEVRRLAATLEGDSGKLTRQLAAALDAAKETARQRAEAETSGGGAARETTRARERLGAAGPLVEATSRAEEVAKTMVASQERLGRALADAARLTREASLEVEDVASLADACGRLEARRGEVEGALEGLRQDVVKVVADAGAARRRRETLEEEAAAATRRLTAAQRRLAALAARVEELRSDAARVDTELTSVRAAVNSAVVLEERVLALARVAAAGAARDLSLLRVEQQRAALSRTESLAASGAGPLREAAARDLANTREELARQEELARTRQEQLGAEVAAAGTALDELVSRWTERFGVAGVVPLAPEQLAWSLMEASGMSARQRRASEEEVRKKQPEADDARVAELVEEATHAKLAGNVGDFVALFGGLPGEPPQDFQATVQQALFLRNGKVQGWFRAGSGSITDRLAKIEDVGKLADELYLGILTRFPDAHEKQLVREHVEGVDAKQRAALVQDMVWALVASVEFRFKH